MMRHTLASALILQTLLFPAIGLAKPANAPAQTARAATIKEGTPLLLSTQQRMVSGETPEGSTVLYKVERDVIGPDGKVLIAAGSTARGKVMKSEGSGFFGRSGALNLSLETVDAVDGTLIPIRSVRSSTGNDSEDMVIVGAVLLSVFFVFMEGDDVEIPAGTIVTAYVDRDANIPKPGAPKVSAAELRAPKSIGITFPTANAIVQKEDKLVFSTKVQPQDDQVYVRLYLDNTLVATQKGTPERIEWDTRRFEKVTGEGEHTLHAEATFRTGQITQSPPVRFTIKD
jgi:hypothetical protein